MKRLTRRLEDDRACFKPHLYGRTNREVCDRLAAYEDTGLDPEEIAQLKQERDAAIEDIFNFSSNKCFCCAHNTHKWLSDGGMDDLCKTCLENGKCNWVWRGGGRRSDELFKLVEKAEGKCGIVTN